MKPNNPKRKLPSVASVPERIAVGVCLVIAIASLFAAGYIDRVHGNPQYQMVFMLDFVVFLFTAMCIGTPHDLFVDEESDEEDKDDDGNNNDQQS